MTDSSIHCVGGLHLLVLLALGLASGPVDVFGQTTIGGSRAGPMQFDRVLLLEPTGETSANVSIGDVTGDGKLDVLLVKGRHWPLTNLVLTGDGNGDFAPARPLGGPADRSYSGVLIDLDRDGDLDVVVSNDFPDPNVVYLNDGNGTFTVASTFGQPEWPTRHVRVADLNGDDFPDVVLANRTGDSSGYNYVCFGRDMGRFAEPCLGFASESATTVIPADFNGDGLLDLAVPHREGGQSHIYLNGGGTFTQRIRFGPPDAAIRSAEAVDFDGDGFLDLAVIDERLGPTIYWGRANTSFGPGVRLGDSDATPYALAVADLNQDGMTDLIIGYVAAQPVAYFGTGRRNFDKVPFGDDLGVAYGFAVGDIDRDGFMDIAMARSDAPNVVYFGGPAAVR